MSSKNEIKLNPEPKVKQATKKPAIASFVFSPMVPRVGIEPTLPKEPDFESGASTNSATPAYIGQARLYSCRDD